MMMSPCAVSSVSLTCATETLSMPIGKGKVLETTPQFVWTKTFMASFCWECENSELAPQIFFNPENTFHVESGFRKGLRGRESMEDDLKLLKREAFAGGCRPLYHLRSKNRRRMPRTSTSCSSFSYFPLSNSSLVLCQVCTRR